MKILIAIPFIAAALVLACLMLAGRKQPDESTQFVHRHDSFKPTRGNAFLLFIATTWALIVIVLVIKSKFS